MSGVAYRQLGISNIHFKPPTEEEVNEVQDAIAANVAREVSNIYFFKRSLKGGDPRLIRQPCGFFMATEKDIVPLHEHFRRIKNGEVQNPN